MFQKYTPPTADGAPVTPVFAADFLIGRIAEQAQYTAYNENRLQANGPVSAPSMRVYSIAEMPIVRVQMMPGVASYEDMSPLITTDGAMVPVRNGGTFGSNLYAAGRMH